MEQVQQANRLALEAVKSKYRKEEIAYEQKVKEEAERVKKGVDMNTQLQKTDLPGTATTMNTSGYSENLKKHNEFYTNAASVKANYLGDVSRDLVNKYNANGTTASQKKGIEDTLRSVFGKNKNINVNKLLDPATAEDEMKKIRGISVNNDRSIYSMYNDMNKQMSLLGNPANEFKSKYSSTINQIAKGDEGLALFTKQRVDQMKNVIIPYFQSKDNSGVWVNDNTKIVAAILKESTNGFWPTSIDKEAIIKKLAKANQDRYGENNIYTEDYFRRNWDVAKKNFHDSFSKIPNLKAWNHVDQLPGRSSNAQATMGTVGNFDYSDRSESSTTSIVEDIFRDITKGMNMRPNIAEAPEGSELPNAGMGVILVDYGDGAKEIKVSNAAAAAELKAIMSDRAKGGTGKWNKDREEYEYGDDVLGGTFSYANIAQGDPNYIQFTIQPSAKYAGSTQKYKEEPGYVSGQPITVRIPKNIAENVLYKQAHTTLNEYLYEKTGSLSGSGDNGNYTISSTTYGPTARIDFVEFDGFTGQFKNQTIEKSYTPDTNIDSIDMDMQNILDYIDKTNYEAKRSAAVNMGLTGDAAINFINGLQ
jgi:hypothetical protein